MSVNKSLDPATGGRPRRPVFSRLYPSMARAMDAGGMSEQRAELVAELVGTVLEVGAGTGSTFPHYQESVERVVAVEPEPGLRRHAESLARTLDRQISVIPGSAEHLPVPDDSVDAVVFSMVLCSVPDVGTALAEAGRALRPGGQVRFLEHVVADTPGLARTQRILDATVWPLLMGGCHVGRDTLGELEAAGLVVTDMRSHVFPRVRTPFSFYVVGTAAPAAASCCSGDA
jgi:ubiquinone/menaquinone biosynthesis C-methylase UbiE